MEQLAPLGPVYQAGTLSGNPVATACGLATLREISQPGFFDELARKTRALVDGLKDAAGAEGVAFCGDSEGGMFGFFLLDALPQNYAQVMKTDGARFNRCSTACWTAASTSRRRCTKPASSAPRTATTTSQPPWRQRVKSSVATEIEALTH